MTELQAKEAVLRACWNVGETWALMALTSTDGVQMPLEAELPAIVINLIGNDRLLRDQAFCNGAIAAMRESALRATQKIEAESPRTIH